MEGYKQAADVQHPREPSPLNLPAERLREPTPDELEIDMSDPDHDIPIDESERAKEDAETLKD